VALLRPDVPAGSPGGAAPRWRWGDSGRITITVAGEECPMNVSAHQLIAVIALILALVSVLPIPNIRPYWTLAVAVLLLALLQFL
jgi:hypothetical protein